MSHVLSKVDLYSQISFDAELAFQGQHNLQNLRRSSNFSSIIHQWRTSLEGWANFRMIQSTTYKDDYADARFGTTENHGNSPSTQMLVLPAIGYFSLETHLHSDPPLLTCSTKKKKRHYFNFYSISIPCSTSITKKQIKWTDKIHFPSERNYQRFLATKPGYYKYIPLLTDMFINSIYCKDNSPTPLQFPLTGFHAAFQHSSHWEINSLASYSSQSN